jgi:hypothetical protein
MRVFLCFVVLFSCSSSFAQDRYYARPYFPHAPNYDYSYNLEEYTPKYPYAKNFTLPFIGLVAGYNVLKNQELELGLMWNFGEMRTDFGMMGGYQLMYRRSIERAVNAVDLEMGIYGLVSVGLGVNYNFSNDISAFGFKPVIGTSIYHFQVLYGYNFIRKKKQEWYNLPQHSLSIRYVLPLKAMKQTEFYLPPAPRYQYLKGLNKKHPLQRQANPRGNNNILY